MSRRQQLAAEYQDAPVSLALLMSSQFVDAAEDLHSVPAGELRNRFLGWMRSPRITVTARNQRG
jgi:hypothetical protein